MCNVHMYAEIGVLNRSSHLFPETIRGTIAHRYRVYDSITPFEWCKNEFAKVNGV